MSAVLLALSLISGGYEMLFLMIGFREYVTWRIAIIWLSLVIITMSLGEVASNLWPQVPLAYFWIIPIVCVTTFMSSRLLYTQWILMLPVATFLNALKRLVGAIMGVIAKAVAQSASPMLLRQAIGLHSTADINLFLASIMMLPVIIILGMLAHRWLVQVSAADFLQRARVNISDYLLVILFFAIYIIAYVFAMEWSVNAQTYMAIAAIVTFGIIGSYLISNKNSHLNDAQLLLQVSNYNELLSHHNRDLHLFKHDYENILLSMSAFIQNNDMAGLKRYFTTEVMPARVTLNRQSGLSDLSRLDIPQIKVVRILGNLLDNATDAAARANHQVALTVKNRDAHTTVFSITNQIPTHEAVDLSVIKKSRFTTKPGHLGYGLSSIEQLTTDQLVVNYCIEEGNFIAELIIKH
ncbi:GHKL domain-containing protein [Lactiplantibacillus plantarum]|uniref:GHKL domain-containing protein n=1 Tax=Lactiplantibacillus plantarum TaxID=1590 RepID=UPI001E30BC9B|nr:GHKL domain-containing protein [Lactiplantibacillus plantarum]MCW6113612.1 GHKL domain-containing protein [Lactiplantibacillus plantarum]